jgi:hypothetical protein
MHRTVVFSVLHRCSDGSVCMLREFVECTAGGSRALRLAFTSVDLDGNGQLDYYELCEALKVNVESRFCISKQLITKSRRSISLLTKKNAANYSYR